MKVSGAESIEGPAVIVIDDDDAVRDSLSMLLESEDIAHLTYSSADAFLKSDSDAVEGCLVVDIKMPGLSGLELQSELKKRQSSLPIIFITGHGDLPMAVEAMREGAIDFMRKPVNEENLLHRIRIALQSASHDCRENHDRQSVEARSSRLTTREREVFSMVTLGQTNKTTAMELGISERTVEVHRSHVMQKMEAKTMADLVRMKIALEQS